MLTSGRLAGFAVVVALLAAPAGAGAAIVSNGDFETGSLSGWQVMETPDPGEGWFAYSGSSSPLNDFPIPAPPQGNFAAITDQGGAGLHLLYQDVSLPPAGSVNQLSLFVYYDSSAPIFSPDNLDFADGPNQQYRVDVLKPGAPIDSVASSDVLMTVFRTLAGDPQTLDPTQKTADLAPLAGQTVRIRLAEVDNQLFFNAGADAVSVTSNGFTIGKATRNKKKGNARLPVTVPDAGTLTVSGKGVKTRFTAASTPVAAGTSNVVIKAKGKTKKKLNSRGKAKVKLSITYTPTGVSANTQKTKLKLKKKT
ncbi:MAG TPA: hypothetical protein VI035_03025 [Solirubrobacterales bacterium]